MNMMLLFLQLVTNYRLIQENKDVDLVEQSISEARIGTDTGSFKFSSTSAYTHQVASQLMMTNSDHTKSNKE